MVRVSRAGREVMIMQSINRLESQGKYKMFTKGEICKMMGRKSDSHMKKVLEGMVDSKQLLTATTAIDGYNHEIAVYGIPKAHHDELPVTYGTYINGEWVTDGGEVLS
jgi:ribosomal protein S2